ncbi:MAG: hypothetical protein GF349_00055 [Candidatus Magasanikbacteria bacterium]|nr:hypothetical protein [Candidatus Magasanikbacteria bacterium]
MKKILITIGLILIAAIMVFFVTFFIRRSKVDQPVDETQTEETQEPEQQNLEPDLSPGDQDRDGISDEEEAAMGTSDTEYDSDGDGLSDVAELDVWQTDPKNVDSDGDGYSDGWEVLKGYNPAGAGDL